MELCDRVAVILKLSDAQPKMGKTAIMKCMYFLQNLKNVPLDYEFEIYTYGPYASPIMDEIEYARQENLLNVKSDIASSGQARYSIDCSETGRREIAGNQFVKMHEAEIAEVATKFGSKTARELELLSTIHFVGTHYRDKNKEEICKVVIGIKPRFNPQEISQGYDSMCASF